MTQDQAEALALEALGWIANSDDLMGIFLGATGASLEAVKTQAADPDFLASVLDFLLMDDTWIVGFCDATQRAYTEPQSARQALPNGALPHWT